MLDAAARRLGYVDKRAARGFAAAEASRLTASWSTSDFTPNSAIWQSLSALRARSRELARNDSYAKRFLAMCMDNIAGPNGMRLQSQVMNEGNGKTTPDIPANIIIERGWERWGKRGVCEITGKMSLAATTRLYVRTVARDGEVLVRRVRGADNPYRYTLQLLDVARLDERYNDDLPGGNVIRMSVEMDRTGRPVAYWLRKYDPRQAITGYAWSAQRERVPASDIFHDFLVEDAEQIRGVPWMHAAMLKLWQAGKFEESAIIAARIGASKLGVIESPTGEPPEGVATGKDSAGNFVTDSEPGQYWTLPQGYTLRSWDPTYPAEAFDPFLQACLRGIASGLNVSYVSLANNLEGVNFSSIRQGVLEERENWKALQGFVIDGFMATIYRDWLETSLLSGALAPLPASKVERFNAPTWRAKRWPWVDPLKDREEAVLAINNGLKSRTQVAADEGQEFEDVLAELAAEQVLAAKLGVTLPDPNKAPEPKPAPADPVAA